MKDSFSVAHEIIEQATSGISKEKSLNFRPENKIQLLEHQAKKLLRGFDIDTPEPILTKSVDEALSVAESIGFPIALKVVSPHISHKSDVGGVIVGINNMKLLEKSYEKLRNNVITHVPEAEIKGVILEKMAPSSLEVIIGAVRDLQFGPAVMFGLGGVFVEAIKDVSFRLAPVNENESIEMIKEIKAYPLLNGYRGSQPMDISVIAKTIVSISQIIGKIDQITEIDLNPALVYPKGMIVVDARIVVEVII